MRRSAHSRHNININLTKRKLLMNIQVNALIVFPGDRFECGHLGFRGTGDMSVRLFSVRERKKNY